MPEAFGIMDMMIFGGMLLFVVVLFMLVGSGGSSHRMNKRIERIQERTRNASRVLKAEEVASLRRKVGDDSLPLFAKLLQMLPNMTGLRDRLERAGAGISAERYLFLSIAVFCIITGGIVLLHQPLILALLLGIIGAVGIPHFYINFRISKRQKAFLVLFPDAIDLIVRGLRSGLPVGESVGLVSKEVAEPVGSVFGDVANSMRLGVPLEKALQDTARKMALTEFNFFVTSIILQRETGGNLGEILNNLSDVLRKRFMMRMKIKAMSSEAKASAIIIGLLPFIVIGAVKVTTPRYLDPLFDDYRGNIAGIAAILSLLTGIGIMVKLARFEI